MRFGERVLELCSKIPKGSVSTYKIIAEKMKTKAYRAIGSALKNNKKPIIIPCHRVVKSDGSLGGYSGIMNNKKKKILLEKEGLKIENNKIKEFEKNVYRF